MNEFWCGLAFYRNAREGLELAQHDQNGGARDEAAHHRMAQELRQKAQSQRSHGKEQGAGGQGQEGGRCDPLWAARHRIALQRIEGHDRGEGHGADREHRAAPKGGIGQQRKDAGVKA